MFLGNEEQTLLWKRGEWTQLICVLVRLYAREEGSSVYLKNLGRGYRSLEAAVVNGLQARRWTINAVPKGVLHLQPSELALTGEQLQTRWRMKQEFKITLRSSLESKEHD